MIVRKGWRTFAVEHKSELCYETKKSLIAELLKELSLVPDRHGDVTINFDPEGRVSKIKVTSIY